LGKIAHRPGLHGLVIWGAFNQCRTGAVLLLLASGCIPMMLRPGREQGGSDMPRVDPFGEDATFFHLPHAKWVVGILSMVIAVVGRESLVGLILRQTRSEIVSLIRDEEPDATAAKQACYENN
jgi:hypothetical protein